MHQRYYLKIQLHSIPWQVLSAEAIYTLKTENQALHLTTFLNISWQLLIY